MANVASALLAPHLPDTMLRTPWFWMVLAVGVLAAAGVALGFERWTGDSPRARAQAQQEEVRELRSRLDACMRHLDRVEDRFWEHERRTSQLRSQVESYESLDPGGVPQDRYNEYLDAFDEYNDAVPEWEARADSVRELRERCREIAELHNEHSDRLRRFLVDEGLLEP